MEKSFIYKRNIPDVTTLFHPKGKIRTWIADRTAEPRKDLDVEYIRNINFFFWLFLKRLYTQMRNWTNFLITFSRLSCGALRTTKAKHGYNWLS